MEDPSQPIDDADPRRISPQQLRRLREWFNHDTFGKRLSDPIQWRLLAQGLLRSGNILADAHQRSLTEEGTSPNPYSDGRIIDDAWKLVDLQIHLTAGMLYGLALEVMTKGLIVKRAPPTSSATRLPNHLKSHSLKALLDRAGLTLTSEEVHLILFLELCVTWMGRYPVPVKGPVPWSTLARGHYRAGTPFKEVAAGVERVYRRLCEDWN